ncbi:MAG: LON peptidase substrate-binding domain-containing protein, partial [Muribaculaceae bacterium]|nr:LON peptidase substrate-binding domain-containing protein [Muribaculaceae bacterium]
MNTASPVNGIMSEVAPDFDFSNVRINEKNMPVIPVRNMVLFPFITVPLAVHDADTLDVLSLAQKNNEAVVALTVKEHTEKITRKDLFRIGVVCVVARIMEMPDGSYTAFMIAANRVKANRISTKENGFFASVEYVPELMPVKEDMELAATFSSISDSFSEILSLFSEEETKEVKYAIAQFNSPFKLMNFIICNSPISLEQKQKLLEESDIKKRGQELLHMLDTSYQMLQLKFDIQERTREDLTRQQRDQFLQQQLKAIKEELGDIPEESDESELIARAEKKEWSKDIEQHFSKELKKLGRFMASTPEYGIQYTYLNTLLSLPWDKKRDIPIDLDHVEEILDRDHYS